MTGTEPDGGDRHLDWLDVAAATTDRVTSAELAEALMQETLALAHAARANGDHQAQRYLALLAGQAYVVLLIHGAEQRVTDQLTGITQRVERLERDCPGIEEHP